MIQQDFLYVFIQIKNYPFKTFLKICSKFESLNFERENTESSANIQQAKDIESPGKQAHQQKQLQLSS